MSRIFPHSNLAVRTYHIVLAIIIITLFGSTSAVNADNIQPITFVSAPRGNEADETALYVPIAAYLSKQIGRTVRYVFIGDWLLYRKAVKENTYDLYFNGPHFSSWLMNYRHHKLIARLAESHTFVVIAKSGNSHIEDIKDLVGRPCCLHAPPNLGTEIFNSAFSNPARLPYTIVINGWKAAYGGVISGKCDGAVLPDTVFAQAQRCSRC